MTRAKREPQRGLTFTESTHAYRLDGKPVPGVTSIIGVLDKPALPKWAAREVAEYVADNPDAVDTLRSLGYDTMVYTLKNLPWAKRDKAADRGHKFHWFAEQILLGNEVDVPEEQVPLVNAALDFIEDWRVEPVAVEQAVGSREHLYAGTVDLVADVTRRGRFPQRAILDWKSSARGVYSSACWQLNAYAFAEFHGLNGDESPVSDWGIESAYGIHVTADGYAVHELKFGPDVFADFLHIRAAYDANKAANGNWKVPGSGYVGAAIEIETAS